MKYLFTFFGMLLFAAAFAQSTPEAQKELELYDTWLAEGKIKIEEYNKLKAKLLAKDSLQQAPEPTVELYKKRFTIKLSTGLALTAASGGIAGAGVVVMNNIKKANQANGTSNSGPQYAIFATSGIMFVGGVALITSALIDNGKARKLKEKVSLIGGTNSFGLAYHF
jgi:hypothetical protein